MEHMLKNSWGGCTAQPHSVTHGNFVAYLSIYFSQTSVHMVSGMHIVGKGSNS